MGGMTKPNRVRMFGSADGFTGRDLIESARDHMYAALVLFQSSPVCLDSAGYLAHLSIELLLKAMLFGLNGEFPAEHDLRQLFRALQREVPGTSLTARGERALDLVNKFGGLRYPQPGAGVEIGSDDVDLIVSLYNSILSNVPDEIRPVQEPHGPVTKHGNRVLMKKPLATPPNTRLQPTAAKPAVNRRGSRRG